MLIFDVDDQLRRVRLLAGMRESVELWNLVQRHKTIGTHCPTGRIFVEIDNGVPDCFGR